MKDLLTKEERRRRFFKEYVFANKGVTQNKGVWKKRKATNYSTSQPPKVRWG